MEIVVKLTPDLEIAKNDFTDQYNKILKDMNLTQIGLAWIIFGETRAEKNSEEVKKMRRKVENISRTISMAKKFQRTIPNKYIEKIIENYGEDHELVLLCKEHGRCFELINKDDFCSKTYLEYIFQETYEMNSEYTYDYVTSRFGLPLINGIFITAILNSFIDTKNGKEIKNMLDAYKVIQRNKHLFQILQEDGLKYELDLDNSDLWEVGLEFVDNRNYVFLAINLIKDHNYKWSYCVDTKNKIKMYDTYQASFSNPDVKLYFMMAKK